MSAIDFDMTLERQPDQKGDRVKVTMSGKFLPYKRELSPGRVGRPSAPASDRSGPLRQFRRFDREYMREQWRPRPWPLGLNSGKAWTPQLMSMPNERHGTDRRPPP